MRPRRNLTSARPRLISRDTASDRGAFATTHPMARDRFEGFEEAKEYNPANET
jgi:hypothetical protein